MNIQMEMGIYPGYKQKDTSATFKCARCKGSKLIAGRKRKGPANLKLGWLCAECVNQNEVK